MMYGGGFHGGMHGAARGQIRGGLRRAEDLVDDVVFGKVYDQKVVLRLFGYLKRYRVRFTLAALAMIVFTLTTVAMPFLVGVTIDEFIAKGNLTGLTFMFLVFVGNGLLNWGSQWLQMLNMAYIGRGILFTLRTQMFDHLQKLSLSFYDRHEVGRIMSRVQNDVTALQEVITTGVLDIVADLLSLGAIIFMLCFMNLRLALITMTVIPVLAVILSVWQKHARDAFMKVRMAISVVNAELQENISGAKVIQSLSREDVNLERFDAMNEANLDANLQASRLSAGLLPVVELLMGSATALVIIVGGFQALNGQLLVGQLVAFVLYVQRFFDPVRRLSMQYTQLQRAMAGGQRIFEVLDTRPEINDAPDAIELPPIQGEIKFDHVSFEYVPGLEVLHDINLHIHPGETVALVGLGQGLPPGDDLTAGGHPHALHQGAGHGDGCAVGLEPFLGTNEPVDEVVLRHCPSLLVLGFWGRRDGHKAQPPRGGWKLSVPPPGGCRFSPGGPTAAPRPGRGAVPSAGGCTRCRHTGGTHRRGRARPRTAGTGGREAAAGSAGSTSATLSLPPFVLG